jgi:FkbM family methyltransferase
MKQRILLISPHFSTGGAPQFTLNKIQLLKDNYDIWCVEYDFLSPDFVVQRNAVIDLLKDNFIPLYENKEKLISVIEEISPDLILIEEISETFIKEEILEKIYSKDRNWTIIETTHSSHNNSTVKRYLPDKFNFVSQYSLEMYKHLGVESTVIEYPIDKKDRNKTESQNKLGLDTNKIHILNVGLFTSGKNQGYAFEIARKVLNKNFEFHFVGNLAGNFQEYWKPIIDNKPENCIIWGERTDVSDFIESCDLFLFTSKFELNPLVIKEALCYDIPILMFNLPTYCGSYNNEKNCYFLKGSVDEDVTKLIKLLESKSGNYDFIEIGTSDFDTLIQEADDLKIGLSIEPVSKYLESLPNPNGVIKVNAAVSDKDGKLKIYYISDDKIIEHGLPYYIRGCNSVNKPHNFAIKQIGEELYNELVTVEEIPSISWNTLIETYNVRTIKYLKIDTEGHEFPILKSYFEACKNNSELYADKILFEYNENSNPEEIESMLSGLYNYEITRLEDDILLHKKEKSKKAYVLYSNDKYFEISKSCIESIRKWSDLPIYLYLMNSDKKLNIENTHTINWECNLESDEEMYKKVDSNFYINRGNRNIYKMLIERPNIVRDVLEKYVETVAYIDSDSIATKYVDNIFSMYPIDLDYPYFVEGVYDYLFYNGRGGAETKEDLTNTLEHPVCELFGINQKVRERYRQTGYFVAGRNTIDFLKEWSEMCENKDILENNEWFAPYNEETILNCLLYKRKILDGLPVMYVNGTIETIDKIYKEVGFTGYDNTIKEWLRIPSKKENLLFFHGEKNLETLNKMIKKLEEI